MPIDRPRDRVRQAPAEDIRLGSSQWLRELTQLVWAIGSGHFENQLMVLLKMVATVDNCVVFSYADDEGPGHLFTHGRMDAETAERLASNYVDRYHKDDRNFARLAADDAADDLIPLDLTDGYDPFYRNYFYDRVGLVDKAATIGRLEHRSVYCNFYRMKGSGSYTDEDWRRLNKALPLLTSLISQHYEILQLRGDAAGQGTSSLVHNIISTETPPFSQLTRRERQVCERMLLGYTAVGIGLDLDIAPSSVITYRRRAYQKLDIHNRAELFALCLSSAQSQTHSRSHTS